MKQRKKARKKNTRIKFLTQKRKLVLDKIRQNIVVKANKKLLQEKSSHHYQELHDSDNPDKKKVSFDEDSNEIHEFQPWIVSSSENHVIYENEE